MDATQENAADLYVVSIYGPILGRRFFMLNAIAMQNLPDYEMRRNEELTTFLPVGSINSVKARQSYRFVIADIEEDGGEKYPVLGAAHPIDRRPSAKAMEKAHRIDDQIAAIMDGHPVRQTRKRTPNPKHTK